MSFNHKRLNISLNYEENPRLREAVTLSGFNITIPILKLIPTETTNTEEEHIKKGNITDYFNYTLTEETYQIFKKKPKLIDDFVAQMSGKSRNEILRYLYDNYD